MMGDNSLCYFQRITVKEALYLSVIQGFSTLGKSSILKHWPKNIKFENRFITRSSISKGYPEDIEYDSEYEMILSIIQKYF